MVMPGLRGNLVLIPARGGSKGIPRKNIRLLAGKPLVAHTIEHALQAKTIARVIVSTDDEEIAATSQQFGAEVIWRPAEISSDTATSESALLHVLDQLQQTEGWEPDLVVFLQCTSPVRKPVDIDQAVQTFLEEEADSLLSVVPSHLFIWSVEEGEIKPLNYDYRVRPRRQDRQPEYIENGSIYIFRPWVLRQLGNRLGGRVAIHVMDELSFVDINTQHDLAICDFILSQLVQPQHKQKEVEQ